MRRDIESLLAAMVRAGLTPGAVAAWGSGGQPPLVAVAGRARVQPEPEEAVASTWYDLASLTKPLVTGTLALLAVRDGALTLETTVGEALPAARARPLGAATIRQLLSHASGLPAWAPLYGLAAGPERIAEAILGLGLARPPGAAVEYSCPGFILLGLILERRLGQRLDQAFTARVLDPLGLSDQLGFTARPGRRVAGGAAVAAFERQQCVDLGLDPGRVPPVGESLPDDGNARLLSGVSGNAGLFGTAEGVHRLASEYLAGTGRLLSPGEIERATGFAAGGRSPGEQVRGLGWQLAPSPGCSAGPFLSRGSFGHTGFTGTSVWVDPEARVVMVLLANRHHPNHHEVDLHPVRRRFHDLVVRDVSTS